LYCQIYDAANNGKVAVVLMRVGHRDDGINEYKTMGATVSDYYGQPGAVKMSDTTISYPIIDDWAPTYPTMYYSYYLELSFATQTCGTYCRLHNGAIGYTPPN
jgi:hypothetical protein